MRPLLHFAILLGAGLSLQGTGPNSTATFPGGKVEAKGVCDVRPDSVACWDMAGASSPELVETMQQALNNGNEVAFRLGRKNRYLLVRRPQMLNVSYRLSPSENVYSNFGQNGDPVTDFLRVSVTPTEKLVTLHVQATVQADKDLDLPLKEGSRATLDGWSVEVGASQRVVVKKGTPLRDPNRYYRYGTPPPNTDYWTVVIGLTGREGEYAGWSYTPLEASGTPIRYVDASGKPLTALKALAIEPTLQPGSGYNPYPNNGEAALAKKPSAMVAYFQGTGQAPAFRATTNIDPKWIASLRIRASHQATADLGPFLLDPK